MSAPHCTEFAKCLTFRYRQCRRPLVPQDIKTDGTICVDVGVIDLCREADLGRLEGIVDWEGNGEEKDTSGIRGFSLVTQELGGEQN